MLAYIIRKTLQIVPMLLVLSLLVYIGLDLMPGDAVSYLIGPDAMASIDPAKLDEIRARLGLNDPFIVRYWHWLLGVVQGDFGYSLTSGVPVSEILWRRLPATVELSIAALVISTVLGSVLGIISALRQGSPLDSGLTVAGMIGLSIPEFFFGLMLIVVFSLGLGWFPVGGRTSLGSGSLWTQLHQLALPAFALGIAMTAGVMRYARGAMLDAASRPFMTTARAKGAPMWRVNIVHGFRVALTPMVVLIGFRLPTLISGSVVIEQIFQWPGIGSEFLAAVRGHDYPLIMIIALLSTGAMLAASLIIDLVTAVIDPRVRLEK